MSGAPCRRERPAVLQGQRAQSKASGKTARERERSRQTDVQGHDESCRSQQRSRHVNLLSQNQGHFAAQHIANNIAEGRGDNAHEDGDDRAGAGFQAFLGTNGCKQRQSGSVEPEQER